MSLGNLFRRKTSVNKIAVLMYHRIASPGFDPWDLSVSASNFRQQLAWLKKNYTVIPLQKISDFLQGEDIGGPAICLSFDDVYADNFSVALPMLQDYALPATFFVPHYFVEKQLSFWWDELADLLVENKSIVAAWRWPQTPPDAASQEFIETWEKLRPLSYAAIRHELDCMHAEKNESTENLEGLKPMTKEELSIVGQSGLVSLALHTATHPFLAALSLSDQRQELAENIAWLKSMPGASTTTLAYPYGSYNSNTQQVLKELGITLAFTTQAATVHRGSVANELGRFQVKDWPVAEFERQLKQWFSN